MGIPYSKQINAAFDQVTPLVASGFEVLQTTKNISILLAAIQVLTVILLAVISAQLFALLITINPELEDERHAVVTPIVKWSADILIRLLEYRRSLIALIWIVVIGVCIGGAGGLYYTSRDPTMISDRSGMEGGDAPAGEDIEAIKRGEAQQ